MHVVLLSSPGAGPLPHWSVAGAQRLHAALCEAGHEVRWFAPSCEPASLPAAAVAFPAPELPLHRAAATSDHVDLERHLAQHLRQDPADVVVHLGVGARGSSNLLWLADRMGSATIAVVRATEVVCARGDHVDWRGASCAIVDDPATCSRCCSRGLRRATPAALASRLDLLVASLQTAAAVYFEHAEEAATLERIGVPRRRLVQQSFDELPHALRGVTRLTGA